MSVYDGDLENTHKGTTFEKMKAGGSWDMAHYCLLPRLVYGEEAIVK